MTLGVNSHTLRAQELAVARAFRAQKSSRLEIGIDDQQAMIVEIRDDDMPLVIETNPARRVEVFPECSLEAVLVDERAVCCEELDAMVSSVRHQYLALRIDGQIPRVIELAVLGPFLTKLEEERAVKSEDLDAMVVLIGH